jgi:hypothetical protein
LLERGVLERFHTSAVVADDVVVVVVLGAFVACGAVSDIHALKMRPSSDQPVVDLLRARAAGLGGEHVNDGVARSFCLASELTELGVRLFGPHDH